MLPWTPEDSVVQECSADGWNRVCTVDGITANREYSEETFVVSHPPRRFRVDVRAVGDAAVFHVRFRPDVFRFADDAVAEDPLASPDPGFSDGVGVDGRVVEGSVERDARGRVDRCCATGEASGSDGSCVESGSGLLIVASSDEDTEGCETGGDRCIVAFVVVDEDFSDDSFDEVVVLERVDHRDWRDGVITGFVGKEWNDPP